MQDKRRAEIEAKKQKLAELREARAARQRAENERRMGEAGPSSARIAHRQEVDDLVNSVLGTSTSASNLSSGPSRIGTASGRESVGEGTPVSSGRGTPAFGRQSGAGLSGAGLGSSSTLGIGLESGSGRVSRQSEGSTGAGMGVGGNERFASSGTEHFVEREITPRVIPLVDVEQDFLEIIHKERVTYDKDIQTADIPTPPSGPTEEEIRARILRERELEEEARAEEERKRKEDELERQSEQLEKQLEDEIRELDEKEKAEIYSEAEFMSFLVQSSKVLQRALNDNYDITLDYRQDTEALADDISGRRVKEVCAFWAEDTNQNRSITDLDWSYKFPELSAASYNKNPAAPNEPDGLVCVWNLHLLERPEFVFRAQSDVLSVTFSKFHNNLIFGGTYSGQVLIWDTRAKSLPVLSTPLATSGHTHPVYSMKMVGSQNAHNLITASTDGTVCSWIVDMLAQPQETMELQHHAHPKTAEVAITCMDFPDNETTTFWVGTEEGNIYSADRHNRAASKMGMNQNDIYKGHFAFVSGLDFHPMHGPADFSDLFLSCSFDWTVKLWKARPSNKPNTVPTNITPLCSFEEADDYVMDVKWHPQHPAMFGSVDASGRLDVWNLNTDVDVPTVTTTIGEGRGLNKLQWERKEGRRVAMGGSDGKLYIYDIGDLGVPRESEWFEMQKTVLDITDRDRGLGIGLSLGSKDSLEAKDPATASASANATVRETPTSPTVR